MKAYTDMEQSKKLAEILPVESADMWWAERYAVQDMKDSPYISYKAPVCYLSFSKPSEYNYSTDIIKDFPCWSLSALLSILPPYLFEFERGIDLNVYPDLNGKGWHCSYMPNCTENMKKDKFKLMTSEDNLIDACYELVLKLHEQNIL